MRLRAIVLAALLALLVSACGREARGRPPQSTSSPAAAPVPAAQEPLGPKAAERAAASMILIGFPGSEPTAGVMKRMRTPGWAGVVFENGNAQSPAGAATLINALRTRARRQRLPPPLVVAIQRGGVGDAIPTGRADPRTDRNAAVARERELKAARLLRATGVDAVLGPWADVGVPGTEVRARTLGDDPNVAGIRAQAIARGLRAGRIRPIVGHYPGEGSASADPGSGPASVGLTLDDLRGRDLAAFGRSIGEAAAVQMTTASFVAFDGATPATLLPEAIGMLRAQGWKGPVVSGDLTAAAAVTGEPVAKVAVDAIAAGCDIVWIPGPYEDQVAAREAITRALRRGGRIAPVRGREALAHISALRGEGPGAAGASSPGPKRSKTG